MKTLRDYLERMSEEKIVSLIGDDLFNTMKAWGSINGKSHYNKNNLIEMALTVVGNNLFKKKDSRKLMLRTLSPDTISGLGKKLGIRGGAADGLIEQIAKINWTDNEKCRAIVEIFGLDLNDVFTIEEEDQAISSVHPLGDKFFELLDYQFLIKQELISAVINSDVPRCLIHMPTGAGKTKTCMHGIVEHFIFHCKNKGLVLWLAHSQELLTQAVGSFEKCWKHLGNDKANLYKYWGSQNFPNDDELNGFMFSSFGKIISAKNRRGSEFEKIRKQCVLVIVDEAHKATATETKKTISALMIKHDGERNKSLIGLSATPGRTLTDDASNEELVGFFEKRIISINTENLHAMTRKRLDFEEAKESDVIRLLQERNVLARVEREELEYATNLEFSRKELQVIGKDFDGQQTKDFSKEFLEKVGRIQKRNLEILQRLLKLQEEKLPTIVFACSVLHAKLLTSALKLSGVQAGCVLGESDPKDRERVIAKFKSGGINILINYEVLTTGFDATNIRCVFVTRPTLSIVLYSQMLGRGLRGPRMGGGEVCKLIDVKDNLERFTDEALAFKSFNNYWR